MESSIVGIFAPRQAYVALSRCQKMEGLQVLRGRYLFFPPPSEHMVRFYEEKVKPVVDAQLSGAPTSELMNVRYIANCSNDGTGIPPIPSTVDIDEVLSTFLKNTKNSNFFFLSFHLLLPQLKTVYITGGFFLFFCFLT